MQAFLEGEQNPEVLASLPRGRMSEKHEQLIQAMQGILSERHCFLLRNYLRQGDFLDTHLAGLDWEIVRRLGVLSNSGDPDNPDPSGGQPGNWQEREGAGWAESAQSTPTPSSEAEGSQGCSCDWHPGGNEPIINRR